MRLSDSLIHSAKDTPREPFADRNSTVCAGSCFTACGRGKGIRARGTSSAVVIEVELEEDMSSESEDTVEE